MFLRSILLSVIFLTSGCEESQTSSGPVPSKRSAAAQDDSQQRPDRVQRERQDPRFYPMTGQRPDEVCKEEGFAYLWKGFLLKECGSCHFDNNRFGVTPFADRNNLASSFQVMISQVDLKEFVHAITENPLCIKCILHAEDQLRADMVHFVDHMTRCEQTLAN